MPPTDPRQPTAARKRHSACQGVRPRPEPFIASRAPGLLGGDQRIAHRDLCVFAIPQQAPAEAEEPVAVGAGEIPKRVG